MDKSIILTLSIGIIAAVIITSVLLTTYMANANSLYSLTDDTGKVQQARRANLRFMLKARKWINSIKGRNCLRSLELSEEFKENVMTIINEDPDVQNLLNEGYEVVKMKPIIKAVIEGDGVQV